MCHTASNPFALDTCLGQRPPLALLRFWTASATSARCSSAMDCPLPLTTSHRPTPAPGPPGRWPPGAPAARPYRPPGQRRHHADRERQPGRRPDFRLGDLHQVDRYRLPLESGRRHPQGGGVDHPLESASVTVRGAPGRGSSARPSSRRATKRLRQVPTVALHSPSRGATAVLFGSSAQARTMRARRARRCVLLGWPA